MLPVGDDASDKWRELQRMSRLLRRKYLGLQRLDIGRLFSSMCWLPIVVLVILVGGFIVITRSGRISDTPVLMLAQDGLRAHAEVRLPKRGIYDVVVLGAGVAGMSAALYAARAGLSVLVLGSMSAGQLASTRQLQNYPGWQDFGSVAISEYTSEGVDKALGGGGPGLLAVIKKQAAAWGASFTHEGILALGLHLDDRPFSVQTTAAATSSTQNVRAHAVVVATGSVPRRLEIEREDMLWGSYLHTCVICDGSLYSGEDVLVVGGGDAAIDAAIYLARLASRVFLVHRRSELRASNAAAVAELRMMENVEWLMPYNVIRWAVTQTVGQQERKLHRHDSGMKLLGASLQRAVPCTAGSDCTGRSQIELACAGAFLLLGSHPNTQLLQGGPVKLDAGGYVALEGRGTATSVPGVFAAGEVADASYRQAITSAGDGAKAAIDVERWLHSLRPSHDVALKVPGEPLARANISEAARAAHTYEGSAPASSSFGGAVVHNEQQRRCDLTSVDCITATVQNSPVVVFSKSYCPFCRKALQTLEAEGVRNPLVLDLTGPSGPRVQKTLATMTGRRTVPNVFVGGASIGGGDETVALHRAQKLRPLLLAAGALAR